MGPKIFQEGQYTLAEIKKFKKTLPPNVAVYNILPTQLLELYEAQNPSSIHTKGFITEAERYASQESHDERGDWIYFPWNNHLIHTLNEKENFLLRTFRNRNLVTQEEQAKLREITLAFVGLSVGSSGMISCVYEGLGQNFKLSDFDTLDTTNLNRIRARLDQIGVAKSTIVTQQAYEIDPYINIIEYSKGIRAENYLELFEKPTPTIIFEAIDDFKIKFLLRKAAKKFKIPLVMFTNIHDRILIDIERYDQEKNLKIFNGLADEIASTIDALEITPEIEKRLAVELVGKKNVSRRAFASVQEIGKTLTGRPQLMGTVGISGALATYVVRRIILGPNLSSSRYIFDLDSLF